MVPEVAEAPRDRERSLLHLARSPRVESQTKVFRAHPNVPLNVRSRPTKVSQGRQSKEEDVEMKKEEVASASDGGAGNAEAATATPVVAEEEEGGGGGGGSWWDLASSVVDTVKATALEVTEIVKEDLNDLVEDLQGGDEEGEGEEEGEREGEGEGEKRQAIANKANGSESDEGEGEDAVGDLLASTRAAAGSLFSAVANEAAAIRTEFQEAAAAARAEREKEEKERALNAAKAREKEEKVGDGGDANAKAEGEERHGEERGEGGEGGEGGKGGEGGGGGEGEEDIAEAIVDSYSELFSAATGALSAARDKIRDSAAGTVVRNRLTRGFEEVKALGRKHDIDIESLATVSGAMDTVGRFPCFLLLSLFLSSQSNPIGPKLATRASCLLPFADPARHDGSARCPR